mgnify:CR=1 FL=1
MEFRFELPDGYSYQDMLTLCRVYRRKSTVRRWLSRLFRLAMLLFGGSMLLSALWWLDGGYTGETPLWVLTAWPLFMGTLLLALALFQDYLAAWGSRRRNLQNTGSILVCLNEDGVTLETKAGRETRPYSAFTDVCACKGYWLLFLDQRHAYILPRAAMTAGDPDAFSDFLTEKIGKPAEKIK